MKRNNKTHLEIALNRRTTKNIKIKKKKDLKTVTCE